MRLPARDSADNPKRFVAGGNRLGQHLIRRLVRPVFLAGKKTNQRPALFRDMIADRAAEVGKLSFEGVDSRSKRNRRRDVEGDFAVNVGNRSQVVWKKDADHSNSPPICRIKVVSLRDVADGNAITPE